MWFLGENPHLFAETFPKCSQAIQEALTSIAKGTDRNWYLQWFLSPGSRVWDIHVSGGQVIVVQGIDGQAQESGIEYDHPARVALRTLRQHL